MRLLAKMGVAAPALLKAINDVDICEEVLRSLAYFRRAPKAARFMEYMIDKKRKGEYATIDGLVDFLFRGLDQPRNRGRNALRTLLHRVRSELRRHFETEFRGRSVPYTVDIRVVEGQCELDVISQSAAGSPGGDFER